MSVILSFLLYVLCFSVFFQAAVLSGEIHAHSRHPVVRSLLLFLVLFVVSSWIPPLQWLSGRAVLRSVSGGYLDHAWFFFVFTAATIMVLRNRKKHIQLILIISLALFSGTGSTLVSYTDVSADKVYTLTPYSRDILSRLDSECILTWYRSSGFSKSSQGESVSLVLNRLASENPDRISLYAHDPSTQFSPEFPERIGLHPLETGAYSGVLVEYRGQGVLIPALVEHTLTEYELIRTIESLVTGKTERPVQMLVLGDPQSGYEHLQLLLEHSGFYLVPVEDPAQGLTDTVPLIVIGSQYCDEQTARSIETFITGGGNALFFVSGTSVETRGDWSAVPKKDDYLLALLDRLGTHISDQLLLDEEHYTIIMPSLDGGTVRTVPYPYWITVRESGFDSKHPVFSGISTLQLYWPSPAGITKPGNTVILSTSDRTQLQNMPFFTHPFAESYPEIDAAQQSFALGIQLQGSSRILVFSDEYAVSRLTDFTGSYDNLLLFVNCVEWISGREALTELKRKKTHFPLLAGRL